MIELGNDFIPAMEGLVERLDNYEDLPKIHLIFHREINSPETWPDFAKMLGPDGVAYTQYPTREWLASPR